MHLFTAVHYLYIDSLLRGFLCSTRMLQSFGESSMDVLLPTEPGRRSNWLAIISSSDLTNQRLQ